jgi:predicted TIM-barrel fold metal-dependent hydrolase
MIEGLRILDADRHVFEPSDVWDRYLEPPYHGRVESFGAPVYADAVEAGTGASADLVVRRVDGRPVATVDDGRPLTPAEKELAKSRPWKPGGRYATVFADAVAHGFDAASNLRDMDREGVDVAVHFPTFGLYAIWRDDIEPALSAAICRAYNDWLADFCGRDPARLKGVALIPLNDTRLALEELQRATGELGHVGIFWRPNPLRGRHLDHPDYFPIYAAAADLGVPVCVHEGSPTVLPQVAADRFSAFGRHICVHPMEQMIACLTLCAEGVLERFPGLRVAFMESGCGWLPFWLERMDEHWGHYHYGRARPTGEPPSAYFRRQCFISCDPGEGSVGFVAARVGEDHLVTATDYPHPDAVDKFPDRTVGELVRNPELSPATKRKILWDNPARLYGLGSFAAAARPA